MTIIPLLTTFGHFAQFALPIGTGLHALYKGYHKEALSLGAVSGIQNIVVKLVKNIISAPRPYPNHLRLNSFPSGHTTGAFLAVGFVLALDFVHSQKSNTPYISTASKACIVALAGIVGLSRHLCRAHWPIDIVAGSFIGMFFGSTGALAPQWIPRKPQLLLRP
ncbi:MAG: phosphatase PAP2 family protein [Chlamydiota bacterium]